MAKFKDTICVDDSGEKNIESKMRVIAGNR